jgi:chorismate mutase / prephenate dehydrogenase
LNDEEIERLRSMIADIDNEIMELIAERLAVARRIGAMKITSGKKIKQPEAEKKVKERIGKKATELGLDEEGVKGIFEGIIDASVAEQEKLEVALKDLKPVGKCIIYGGAGGMGKIMSEMLHKNGYEVTVLRSNGAILRYPSMEKADLPGDADFAIVSVPMKITGDTIITALNQVPGKRIYEICSMKTRLKSAISRAEKSGSEVISLHPMFGPGIRAIRDKPVIFCGKPDQFKEDPIWKSFESEGARLLTVPFDDHDKLMSYILQFTHAINIIYSTVLANSGVDPKLLEQTASPICARQLATAWRVSQQDPQLYFEIQRLSDHLGDMYEELGMAQAELIEALASETSGKFRLLMEKGRKYLEGGGKSG